jgi:uncharacterized protein (DUF1919 family)
MYKLIKEEGKRNAILHIKNGHHKSICGSKASLNINRHFKHYSSYKNRFLNRTFPIHTNNCSGSVVVKALGYKQEGRWFET